MSNKFQLLLLIPPLLLPHDPLSKHKDAAYLLTLIRSILLILYYFIVTLLTAEYSLYTFTLEAGLA